VTSTNLLPLQLGRFLLEAPRIAPRRAMWCRCTCPTNRFVVIDPFARTNRAANIVLLLVQLWRNDQANRLADRLLGAVTENALCATVPRDDGPFRSLPTIASSADETMALSHNWSSFSGSDTADTLHVLPRAQRGHPNDAPFNAN
jgi:hypothetical protein